MFQRNALTTAGVTPGIRMSIEKLDEVKSGSGLIPDAQSPGSFEIFSQDLIEEQEPVDYTWKHHHQLTPSKEEKPSSHRWMLDC